MKTIVIFLGLLLPISSFANCNLHFNINGVISPATVDLATRAFNEAKVKACSSIVVSINTPGGALDATRKLVSLVMNSEIPVLCLVEPSGAHAGSAGAIFLQSCHIAGAVKASNLGAATPIMSNGNNISDDLRKKVINDTVSWMDSLTQARKRNVEFGKKIVTEAKAVSAEEAKKIGAIDILSDDMQDFLAQAQAIGAIDVGKGITTNFDTKLPSLYFAPDIRYRLLELVADPQFSYMIFMGSLALIYFEVTHPGMIAPGVIGALGLVVALIAFDKLEVEWGGLILILLGLAFMIAEIFVPSFGALGIGGLIAFVVGGFFLFDPSKGYSIPSYNILGIGGILGAAMLGVAYLAFKTTKVPLRGGYEGFLGHESEIKSVDSENSKHANILLRGEIWQCESEVSLKEGDLVKVVAVDKLKLKVVKI